MAPCSVMMGLIWSWFGFLFWFVLRSLFVGIIAGICGHPSAVAVHCMDGSHSTAEGKGHHEMIDALISELFLGLLLDLRVLSFFIYPLLVSVRALFPP